MMPLRKAENYERTVFCMNSIAEIESKRIKKAVDNLAEGKGMVSVIPGNRPYRDGIPGGSHKPLTSDSCVECGICKDGCPVHAIGDDFKVNPEICIACFRCIRNCPVGAKNMDTEAYQTFAKEFTQRLAVRRENEFFL